ncbi:putative reverse transcriptase domain-containing protein [Tanacetum coccineum]
MSATRQGMSLAEIDQIIAQRVTDAIEVIVVYETKIRMAHDSMNQVVLVTTASFKSEFKDRSIMKTLELLLASVGIYSFIKKWIASANMEVLLRTYLMPVKLGSFDVIIGMDWLSKYHALIVCDEKVVRNLYGNEVLTIHGDGS